MAAILDFFPKGLYGHFGANFSKKLYFTSFIAKIVLLAINKVK